ncbi:MAG: SMC-Scp complex subunit ScpB [Oscillospiraceae bacterium]|nr:SMC-Scp complex subunit ScpB [Oscillospiraceae bacterium]MDY4586067.1 SMC-Scp complex subunit ScpB [Oscillospiraceae bacterium]
MTIEQAVKSAEAIIFAGGDGVSPRSLTEILEIDEKRLKYIIETLKEKYNVPSSGVKLVANEENICLVTDEDVADIVKSALSIKKSAPLSAAAMETLAIIAYNQPVSRAFIEQVRGIDSTSSVQTLITKGLVEEAGRLDIPGHPLSYRTTGVFLRSFGLDSLSQLPKIKSDKSREIEGQISAEEIIDGESQVDY